MTTQIIYDEEGFIISQMQGSNLREPVGIPFLWVEIPEGKKLVRIDVTVTPNIPIFEDLPKSDLELLQSENTKIKLALAELAELIGGTVDG